MSQYNYYKARWSVVTAKRARLMGVQTNRAYGYYLLIDPPNSVEGRQPGRERIQAWCKSKSIGEDAKRVHESYQIKGYYGCSCGSNKQAVSCCGKV